MSESESSDQEDPNDPGMTGNSSGDISSQVNDLLQISETNKVGVKVSSKPPTHYKKQQKRSNFLHLTHHQSQKLFYGNIKGQGRDHTWTPKRRVNQINTNLCQITRPPIFSGESY